jgi:hypothetical protein
MNSNSHSPSEDDDGACDLAAPARPPRPRPLLTMEWPSTLEMVAARVGGETLRLVCEGRCESAPFCRPEGAREGWRALTPAHRARHDETCSCVFVETAPSLHPNNFHRGVGDGWVSSVCQRRVRPTTPRLASRLSARTKRPL